MFMIIQFKNHRRRILSIFLEFKISNCHIDQITDFLFSFNDIYCTRVYNCQTVVSRSYVTVRSASTQATESDICQEPPSWNSGGQGATPENID